jgi:hypothetical protein
MLSCLSNHFGKVLVSKFRIEESHCSLAEQDKLVGCVILDILPAKEIIRP